MALEIGQTLDGKYRIVRIIGEGGMGAVYEGENVRINRRVAIKVLHAAFAGNVEVMRRFEREAQAAGRIGNDHILEVLDLGELPEGDRYIIMEFLDGEPLSKRIERLGRLTAQQLAPILRQVLVGLGAAHTAGIVHRDLKPDNIFILKEKAGKPDFVKIIDFGISKFSPLNSDGMKMTRTGSVMGTPYYMSPEQASGSADADQRSDIYALGVILYEAVTGRVPFDGETFNQLMFKIVLSEVQPPESLVPDLDSGFASLIRKAMSKDARLRFQSTQEFLAALDQWSQDGAAVSVSPHSVASAAGFLPPEARASFASAPGLSPGPASSVSGVGGGPTLAGQPNTGNSWESSQVDAVPPVPRKRPVAAIAAAAALLLGGSAFGAYSILGAGSSSQEQQAAAAQETASVTPPPETPAPEVVASAPPAAAPSASAPESVVQVAEAGASAAPVASAAAPAPVKVARPRRPAPKPVEAKKPAAAATTAKKTATPDFGY